MWNLYFPSIAAVKRYKAGKVVKKGCEEAEYDEEGSNDGDKYEEEEDRNDETNVELVDGENECPVLNISTSPKPYIHRG